MPSCSYLPLKLFDLSSRDYVTYIVFILRHTAAAHSRSLFSVDTVTVTYSLIFSPGNKVAPVDWVDALISWKRELINRW